MDGVAPSAGGSVNEPHFDSVDGCAANSQLWLCKPADPLLQHKPQVGQLFACQVESCNDLGARGCRENPFGFELVFAHRRQGGLGACRALGRARANPKPDCLLADPP